jgi:hypothetical protein
LKFINYWQEQVADLLPGNYEARIGEYVYVMNPHAKAKKKLEPDVLVAQTRKRRTGSAMPGGTATLEPVTIPNLIMEEVREPFIQLIHRPQRNVVAVLELLSPTNKAREGREIYLRKRNAVIQQGVHLVELDLLLKGRPAPLAKPLPQGDYHYLVTRSASQGNCEVFAWNLSDGLPTLPVPLLAPDGDIHCELGKVFSIAFERGRYRQVIDYRKPPRVPLSEARKKWVRQQVRAAESAS